MVTTSDLKMKEVINVVNGTRIGFIYDFEINLEKSRVESIIVPKEGKFLKIFSKDNDYIIPWKRIVKVGQDIILVEIKDSIHYQEEEENGSKSVNFFLENIKSEDKK
ncbi:YlmC/YmxH family sporulation protein [Paramaledivibacter caminithermalis]|jgi:YlmC/YmxH family sporulation protein|uniref:Sporulation protein, YlmC/YmxH family n=1 Tax=Paramaledivibacter caminithermalis (strain DSM 15212 / CIP 107654 / DViRD3) TaxID=1121301 RepID=A0A1M6S434_PARC5|nr:YlmC/YmxH family sporulation protein [Paramaledivibacter caminithermalis]SHK39513.1 sporulation protein, YlmC/YmxH family [Paramaledivibacter caminithermalis DSM 15212]